VTGWRPLQLARDAAIAAGGVLLSERSSVIAQGPSATKSSATDPVTRADMAAQQVIADMLATARPADGLLGEEGLDRAGETGWEWIIDPLDGTVNYLYGSDEWAVSIAARDDAGTAVGVVHAPALGRTYTAVRGEGCYLDGRRLAVHRCLDLSRAVVGTGFSYDAATRAAQAAVLARVLPRVADIRRCGSAALELARVASGRLDAFYEDDLQEWDWAAGALLASEAGAAVSQIAGPGQRSGILAAGPDLAAPLTRLLTEPAGHPFLADIGCQGRRPRGERRGRAWPGSPMPRPRCAR
jgi:myo-inositol-1(or 4)-monophosphatase